LVAGESSGDLLGAGLVKAIQKQYPDAVFEGVAGPEMLAAGCDQWEPAESLAVFGLIEPLAHLPRLLRLRKNLVDRWIASPPDVFVGIDAPDFNLGLEKRLRGAGIKTVHYVSPSIWAWRSGRIKTVKAAADKVLCILPFEPLLYDEAQVDAVSIEDAHRHNDLGLLELFSRTKVLLGVIAIARSRLESAEEVRARLVAALDHIDPARLIAAPDCGLGFLGQALTRDKLRALAAAAHSL